MSEGCTAREIREWQPNKEKQSKSRRQCCLYVMFDFLCYRRGYLVSLAISNENSHRTSFVSQVIARSLSEHRSFSRQLIVTYSNSLHANCDIISCSSACTTCQFIHNSLPSFRHSVSLHGDTTQGWSVSDSRRPFFGNWIFACLGLKLDK